MQKYKYIIAEIGGYFTTPCVLFLTLKQVRFGRIHIDETVSRGGILLSYRIPDERVPVALGDPGVVKLAPLSLNWIEDIGPVMTSVGLTLVNQDRMQAERVLE